MDVSDMYEHTSVTIWPQNKFPEINLRFVSCTCKRFISIWYPTFVLKDNYNRYYHKNFVNVTCPSNCQLFLQTSPTSRKKLTKRKTDHSLLVPGKYQKSLSTLGKKWEFGEEASNTHDKWTN